MADKKGIFGIAKGSPAVGIPMAVAKLGGKVQEAHGDFARKHPKIHSAHKSATKYVRKVGRKAKTVARGAYRKATR